MCGRQCFLWSDLWKAASFLEGFYSFTGLKAIVDRAPPPSSHSGTKINSYHVEQFESMREFCHGPPVPERLKAGLIWMNGSDDIFDSFRSALHATMIVLGIQKTSEPRDHIYVPLGMIRKAASRHGRLVEPAIRADYQKPVTQVFQEIT